MNCTWTIPPPLRRRLTTAQKNTAKNSSYGKPIEARPADAECFNDY
jgi:hypothetical protein